MVEGYFAGRHRSPYRGLSSEFVDYRAYTQGDDIRHVDWKVYGRTNKFYIRRFEQETNLNLIVAVDCSESMSYASASSPMPKHTYAVTIAAALAYMALQQRDAVGLATYQRQVDTFLRPTNAPGQWKVLIDQLATASTSGATGIRHSLDQLADRLDRRCMVVVLSDLLDDDAEILRGLRHLAFRRHDLVVFQVLDVAEIDFPFDQPIRFDGLEQAGQLMTEPAALRASYQSQLAAFTDRLRRGCRSMNIDYLRVSTQQTVDHVLRTFLAKRASITGRQRARTGGGAG